MLILEKAAAASRSWLLGAVRPTIQRSNDPTIQGFKDERFKDERFTISDQ